MTVEQLDADGGAGEESLGRTSVRGGVAVVASRGLVDVVRLGSILVLARLLDPSEFGVVAMVSAVVGIAAVLQDFGLSTASVQRRNLTDGQASTLMWINVGLAVVLTSAMVLLAPVFARGLRSDVEGLVILIAPMFVISALSSQHLANLQRALRFTTLASIRFVKAVVYAAVTVAMAWAGFGRSSLVWGLIISTTAETLFAIGASPMKISRPRVDAAVIDLIKFGGGMLGYTIATYVGSAVPTLAIARVQGAEATGIWGRAQRLVGLSTGYLLGPAGSVVFPVLARLVPDPPRWRRYYYRVQELVALPTLVVCSLLAVHPSLVVDVALGDRWAATAPVMRWLALAAIVTIPCLPTGWALASQGRGDRLFRWGVIGWPVIVVGVLIGVPHGPEGAALGYAVGAAAMTYPCLRYTFAQSTLTVRSALIASTRAAPAALCSVVGSLAVAHVIDLPSAFLQLTAVGFVHFGIYIVVVWLTPSQRDLVRTFVRQLRARS